MLANRLEWNGMSFNRRTSRALAGIPALVVALSLMAPASQAVADEGQPLRFCADPTNLPFSSDDPANPGFYLEIGQALAKALDRPVVYDWYKSYFGKRTVRVTLLGKQCDAMIGLTPTTDFMGPAVIFSKPIIKEGYALVTAKGRKISGLADLKQLRVAVQYQTTPQNMLAQRDEIEKVTVISPDEGMKALDQGRADVAFVWGPVAGWLNKTVYSGKYEIQSVDGDALSWPVAIGFAKASTELRDQIDAALPKVEAMIPALVEKYGLPTDTPVKLTALAQPLVRLASAETQVKPFVVADSTTAPSPTAAVPAPLTPEVIKSRENDSEAVTSGRETFNGTCAHCHGPDAVQSERHIDLRRLHKKYGDDMRDAYWKTVHNGRPAKGMPAWKDVFDDKQLNEIYAYLLTVQVPAD